MNNQQTPSPIENSKPICCGKSICDIQVGYIDGRLTQRFRPTKQVQQKLEALFNQLLEQGYEWLEAYTKGEEVFVRGLGSDSVAKIRDRNDLLVNAQNFWQVLSGRETGLKSEISSSQIKDSILAVLNRTNLALSLADEPSPEPTDKKIDATIQFLKGNRNNLDPLDALKAWAIECQFTNQEEIRATLVRALSPIIFDYFDTLEELKTHREAVSDESRSRASTPRKISAEILSLVDEAIKSRLTNDQIKNLMDDLYRRLSNNPNADIGDGSKKKTIRDRAQVLAMKPKNVSAKNNNASKAEYESLKAKINAGHFDTI